MKILISGTFCSGKTTLSLLLKEEIDKSYVIGEPIRELFQVFSQSQIASIETRDYLLIRQLFEEKRAAKQFGFLICDAGVESVIAHNRLFKFHDKMMLDLSKFEHDKYDLVFFCNYAEVPLIEDGFRNTNPSMRTELSNLIEQVLIELNYAPIEHINIMLRAFKTVKYL